LKWNLPFFLGVASFFIFWCKINKKSNIHKGVLKKVWGMQSLLFSGFHHTNQRLFQLFANQKTAN
jgi:hypothetical protein